MSQPEEQEEHVDENYDPEKEVLGDWKPTIDLPEIQTVTGEEEEEEITKFRIKLYRWRDSEWKERGVGDIKFLKHKQSNKIRLIMRADKTGKVVANHYVQPYKEMCKLQPQKTNEKAVIWDCYDVSDDEGANFEKLCARFTSVEEYKRFEVQFNEAYEANKEIFSKSSEKEGEKKESEEEKK